MSVTTQNTLAIDFGTSNSAVAVLDRGVVRRVPLETGSETLPTAVFFPLGGPMKIGTAAGEALIAGDEGRYMRALKSVLGTSLFHESRAVGGKRQTLADIVTAFLVEVKCRAEAVTGMHFTNVVSGRPVHFHSADAARDARAQDDLAACYRAAGFENVRFVYEPEAAALASHGLGRAGELGLIVDIGGGTSDFSVFRATDEGLKIPASHGIRLGGTDFDQAVSLSHAMPLLGYGGRLKREMGAGLLPMPNAIYVDLATWAKIPFLYSPETRRDVAEMQKRAVEPRMLARLATVLEDELGHDLAFSVERGKIAANGAAGEGRIAMGLIEPGLHATVTRRSLDACLDDHSGMLTAAMEAAIARARVSPEAISSVILVGGSSLMDLVSEVACNLCPGATLERSEAFTAVVDGLALAIGQEIGVTA